jgi:acyl-CoA reductase-like NAD-dependent aldehyde dehydrogenase
MAPVQLPEVTHEDARGFWAAAIAGAGAILAWLGRAIMIGKGADMAAPNGSPDPEREAKENTRRAIARLEEKVDRLATESSAAHARAEAQRDAMLSAQSEMREWLKAISDTVDKHGEKIAAIMAVDEDRKERRKN